MPTEEQISKMLAAKESLIPTEGYNLVGLDDFEDPGEELYLIGNYATAAEAEVVKVARENAGEGDRMFIYGPDDA